MVFGGSNKNDKDGKGGKKKPQQQKAKPQQPKKKINNKNGAASSPWPWSAPAPPPSSSNPPSLGEAVRMLGSASREVGASSLRRARGGASAAASAAADASRRAATGARTAASAAASAAAAATTSAATSARSVASAAVAKLPEPWTQAATDAAHHPLAPPLAAAGVVALLALRVARKNAQRRRDERRRADPFRSRYARVDTIATLLEVTSSGGDQLDLLSTVVRDVEVVDAGARVGYFPPSLCAMRVLERVCLAGSAITYLPAGIGGTPLLRTLDVSRCQLRSLPPEIGLCANLTHLDASRNSISALPDTVCDLKRLESLNLMGNGLQVLPERLGKLTKLKRLGLKSNRLKALPESIAQCRSLEELYVTDNALRTWPTKGLPKSLIKLQAAFNKLTAFTPEMAARLPRLEFLRLSSTRVAGWDAHALVRRGALPSLSWVSLGATPSAAALPPPPSDLPAVPLAQVQVGRLLGSGASGDVFAASVLGTPQVVALKIFRSDVSPDGRTMDEVALSSVVRHPNLPRVRAVVPSSPAHPQIALVMDLAPGGPLADKPNSASLLRCRWPDAALRHHGGYPAKGVFKVARGVASALAYLHAMGVAHGDVYAHNVLVETHLTRSSVASALGGGGAASSSYGDLAGAAQLQKQQQAAYGTGYRTSARGGGGEIVAADGGDDDEDGGEDGDNGSLWHATLCDLGAAFCYARDAAGGGGGNQGAATGRGASFYEAVEARAFGLMLRDLLDRTDRKAPVLPAGATRAARAQAKREAGEALSALERVAGECLASDPRRRPTFRAVLNSLDAVATAHAAARAKRRAAAAAEAAKRAKQAKAAAAKIQLKAELQLEKQRAQAEKQRAEMERRNAEAIAKARKQQGALDVSAFATLYGKAVR